MDIFRIFCGFLNLFWVQELYSKTGNLCILLTEGCCGFEAVVVNFYSIVGHLKALFLGHGARFSLSHMAFWPKFIDPNRCWNAFNVPFTKVHLHFLQSEIIRDAFTQGFVFLSFFRLNFSFGLIFPKVTKNGSKAPKQRKMSTKIWQWFILQ